MDTDNREHNDNEEYIARDAEEIYAAKFETASRGGIVGIVLGLARGVTYARRVDQGGA